jgi:sulfotransferase family protein
MKALSVAELLSAAEEQTGLSHFGRDNFREGLEALVAGVNGSGLMIPGREPALHRDLVRLLVNRLRWQKDLADHPAINEQRLLPPLAIVSLPRTGTTKIQRFLAETEAFQDLAYWQILMPGRIPGLPDHGVEQRMAETEAFCAWRVSVQPDIQKTHRITARESEEDIFLQEIGFRSKGLGFIHQSAHYHGWLAQQDISLSYGILKQQLQYLQWQFHAAHPKPWLLKSPVNLGMEDQLQKIFPAGMKVICPHREPSEIFPSLCRLVETYTGLYYKLPMRRDDLGQFMLAGMAQGMQQHMQWRERNRSVPILDLGFKEICADSIKVSEKIYDFIGIPFSSEARKKIAEWDARNPRHADGKVDVDLGTYGLSEREVNAQFGQYREKFSAHL